MRGTDAVLGCRAWWLARVLGFDVLNWIEAHPGLASWLQAIGSIVAIGAAFLISYLQIRSDRRHTARERSLRAQGIALLLHTEMVEFGIRLRAVIDERDVSSAARLEAPTTLLARVDELYLLGPSGGALLQMVSSLNATRPMSLQAVEAMADHGLSIDDVWAKIGSNLGIASADVREAIAGMDAIISEAAARSRRA